MRITEVSAIIKLPKNDLKKDGLILQNKAAFFPLLHIS